METTIKVKTMLENLNPAKLLRLSTVYHQVQCLAKRTLFQHDTNVYKVVDRSLRSLYDLCGAKISIQILVTMAMQVLHWKQM